MPNKYTSPKADFLKVKARVSAHGEMVESNVFNWSVETAKAEYIRQLCAIDTVDPHISMMRFQRMAGMEEFLKILYNLAEEPAPPARVPDQDNLTPPGGKPRRH